ncbi:MAG: serine/threonine-protein kinase [Myxococcota bacterium]|nr:serine/threonine-protein kinase [Myxococcota bacterium]
MSGVEQNRTLNKSFGKYTLIERIGVGGMAEIWRGKIQGAHGFEKEVAIKKILPNLSEDEEFLNMFIDEAKIMVGLVHANIVQVSDLDEIDGQWFIGMEYVYGKDLLDVLARCAEMQLKIPLKLAIFVQLELLKGLDYAHKYADIDGNALNIIHRDVSPSNVLVSYAGDVKVGDFGVAKATSQRSKTEIGTLKGKVGYMSPEQVKGDSIDRRSDIFASGIILYEMLNMRRLFTGGSDLDIMLRVRDVSADKELAQGISLPEDLAAIVRKALARNPDERYQSCGDFHDDLLEFLYRNRLRVTSSDLGRFMERLFQKDIEQDKIRRQKLRDQVEATATEQAKSLAAPSSPRLNEVSKQTRFRYRDRSGLVYGPMSFDTLTHLLAKSEFQPSDQIARDSGDWRPIGELPSVLEAVAVAKRNSSKLPPVEDRPRTPSKPSVLPRTGSLDESPVARLLFDLKVARAGGCLTIRQGDSFKSLFLANGAPIAVNSNVDSELLGNFLVREGLLNQAQIDQALQRAKAFGGRLGDALVADRLIQSHVLFEYLHKQAKSKLFDLFSWNTGTYEYDSRLQQGVPSFPLGIDLLDIVIEGINQHTPVDYLRGYFTGREFVPLTFETTTHVQLDDLRLSAKQLRIAGAIRGFATLDSLERTLTAGQKLSLEDIHRLVYLLLNVRSLSFRL